MFKKLKTRIEEGVKQSPLKLPTSVQQFTQAVSSTSPNNSTSYDNIPQSVEEKNEDEEESEKGNLTKDISSHTEYDSSFTNIDLRSSITPPTRRLSSSSSITNDLFPIYEFPANKCVIQSDLESCSEFDDGSIIQQFGNVTKENLYEKYRGILQKYHKYRGRFVDVKKYCEELQREQYKAKNILAETQDKAIRRIAELKEQCSLEQKAKAHLEDALRNELEERDHVITTLNTKIELLKSGKSCDDEQIATFVSNEESKTNSSEAVMSDTENEIQVLKDKIKNFETLLSKAKDAITSKNDQIKDLKKRLESGNLEQKVLRDSVSELRDNINSMKKKEEEALLTLAENKLQIHQELDAKEIHIKGLEKKISELSEDMKKYKNASKNLEADPSNIKKIENLQDEIEVLKSTIVCHQTSIAEKDRLLNEFKSVVNSSSEELLKLRNEIKSSKLIPKNENLMNVDLESELTEMINHSKSLESALAVKHMEFENLVSQLKEDKINLENKLISVQNELDEITNGYREKANLCSSFQELLKTSEEELEKTKNSLAAKTIDIQTLENKLSSSNSRLVSIMNEQKNWTDTEKHLKVDKIVLEETLKSAKAELTILKKELVEAKTAIAKFENEKESLDVVKAELASKINIENEMLDKNSQLIDQIHRLKVAEECYATQIKEFKLQIDELKKNNSDSESLRKEIEGLRNENKNTEKRFEDLQAELKSKNVQLNEITTTHQRLADEMSHLEDVIKKKKTIEDDLANVRTELQLKDEQLKEVTEISEELKLKLSNIQLEIELRNEQIEDLKVKTDTVQKVCTEHKIVKENLVHMEEEVKKLVGNVSYLSETNNYLQIENNNLISRCSSLEKKLSDVEANLSAGNELLTKKLNHCQRHNLDLEQDVSEAQTGFREKMENFVILLDKKDRDIQDLKIQNNQLLRNCKLYSETFEDITQFINELNMVYEYCLKLKNSNKNLKCENEKLHSIQIILESKLESMTEELNSLSLAYRNMNSANKIDKSVLLFLRSQLSSLQGDLRSLKRDFFDDLNIIKKYFDEFEVQIENGLLKNMQESYKNHAELNSKIKNVELECENLKKEKMKLTPEKKLLQKSSLVIEDENKNQYGDEIQKLKYEYSSKIEKITADFEKILAKKDIEYCELRNELSESINHTNAVHLDDTTKVVQNLEEKLNLQRETYEKLLETHKQDIEKLNNEKASQQELHEKELKENDKKWRSCLDKKIQEVEDKYKEEINELTREWSNDRKVSNVEKVNCQVLEGFSLRAENCEVLKQQVQTLSNELYSCKKAGCNKNGTEYTLDDFTELEYLRNILFEYMMGRQPLVLAKVLAAVVKFDDNQTRQVLQREEQKLSLIGGFELRVT